MGANRARTVGGAAAHAPERLLGDETENECCILDAMPRQLGVHDVVAHPHVRKHFLHNPTILTNIYFIKFIIKIKSKIITRIIKI